MLIEAASDDCVGSSLSRQPAKAGSSSSVASASELRDALGRGDCMLVTLHYYQQEQEHQWQQVECKTNADVH